MVWWSFRERSWAGLASGGGTADAIFTRLGAECTILDYSDRQLEAERKVARREGYAISIIKGDMTQAPSFEDGSFDIIFHPVSNCYVEDVYHVWNECIQVLKAAVFSSGRLDNGPEFPV